MTKQHYKKYSLSSRSDFIIYLRQLIVQTNKWMIAYNKYTDELAEKIEVLKVKGNPERGIDSDAYDESHAKIMYAGSKLLNLLGDHATSAMSYNKFRTTLIKRNIEVKKDLGPLPELEKSILKQLNTARNWGLHEPESLIHAHIENIKRLWKPKEVEQYLSEFNPIGVPYFEKLEGSWLLSLYEETLRMKEAHNILYQSMLEDYSKLIGVEVNVKEHRIPMRPFKSEILLAKTSFEMQRGGYKK